MTTRVNGELRQDDTTANLIFPFARLIEYLSSFMRLMPGDLIATGTPTGAGARFDPPKYLRGGDTVEVHVPELGTLRNVVVDEVRAERRRVYICSSSYWCCWRSPSARASGCRTSCAGIESRPIDIRARAVKPHVTCSTPSGCATLRRRSPSTATTTTPRKVVRLSADNFNGRSLTAVTIAAHEVGHALQDARGFAPLHWRTRLVHWVAPIEKVGAGMLMLAPLAGALTRSPYLGLIGLAGGLLTLGTGVVIHFLTLPTELDASFMRALPLMQQHGVIRREDLPRARRLLTAAAFTYVAVALQSLLNIARWWAILRR